MDIDKLRPKPSGKRRWLISCLLAGLLGVWLAAPDLHRPQPDLVAPAVGDLLMSEAVSVPLSPSEEMLSTQHLTLPGEKGGQERYKLAIDELYIQAPGREGTQKITAMADVAKLLEKAEREAANSGHWPGLVIYPEKLTAQPEARRILTSRLLVKLKDEKAALTALAEMGMSIIARPAYALEYAVVSAGGSPLEALKALAKLQRLPSLAHVAPLLKRGVKPAAAPAPKDPLYARQWHLENVGQVRGKAGFDINVKEIWQQYKGQGIKIAIVDDGLQIGHPDLLPNAYEETGILVLRGPDFGLDTTGTVSFVATNLSYSSMTHEGFDLASFPGFSLASISPADYDYGHIDWLDGDRNPSPHADALDYHGTAVGGVAAARGDNNIGVTGVAPLATLIGHRFLGPDILLDDAQVADIIARGHKMIDIKNNSWGYIDSYAGVADVGPLHQAAMKASALEGRSGRGGISVWAAGNGRQYYFQGNKNGLANDIHGIAVGAVTNAGKLSPYSETGAHLAVVAPSDGGSQGIVTTDLVGTEGYNPDPKVPDIEDDYFSYTQTFGGTSSAAPVVSGVIALMLEANPALNWRDVKEILLRSSRKIDPKSASWVQRKTYDRPDLPPIKHSTLYGGGLIQATQAVEMARTWQPLGPQVSAERILTPNEGVNYENNPKKGIQSAAAFGAISRGSTSTSSSKPKKPKVKRKVFDFTRVQSMSVEHVTLTLNLTHTYRGDLKINLISPSGTVSTLAKASIYDFGASYNDFTFSTLRHWGESPKGKWTLEITDTHVADDGVLNMAKLVIYGAEQPAATILSQTGPQIIYEGTPLSLSVDSLLPSDGKRVWRKNARTLSGRTQPALPLIPAASLSDAGTYDHILKTYYADIYSLPMPVAVVRKNIPSIFKNEGETASFRVNAAGPNLLYQWRKQDVTEPLVDNGRITGSRSAQLTIRDIKSTDLGSYYCEVTMVHIGPDLDVIYRLATDAATLGVQRRAVVQPGTFDLTGRVGATVTLQLTADSSVTRYNVVGLPAGMTYDPRTGTISGAPAAPGFYTIYASATNKLGTSEWTRFEWEVAPLPGNVVGTFQGLVERHTSYTGGYGGSVTLVVNSLGSFSGTVTRGAHVQSITGRLNISVASDAAFTGRVTLPRRTPFAPLDFSFSIHPGTGALTGSLSDLTQSPPDLAEVSAVRLSTDTAALVGRWNVAYRLPSPLVGNATYPQGSSWITQTISPDGSVNAVIRLADGSAATSSRGVSSSGQSPLHAMLYELTGSVQGWQSYSGDTRTLAGQLSWLKSANLTSRSYSGGFSLSSLGGLGAAYSAPVVGTWLFGETADAAQGRFVFLEGGLSQAFVQPFSLSGDNVILMPTGSENPHQIQASLDLSTGIITGTGTAMDIDPENPALNRQRPGSFSALFIPTQTQAHGHFLLPVDSSATAPVLSGEFVAEKEGQ